MSSANFARNQSVPYNQVNSQKTLIYDLRSELSNLKNQFSRLISKPADLGSKSKIQVKTGAKSRYHNQDCDTSLHESQVSPSSQSHISYKSTEAVPRLNLVRTDSHLDNKTSQPFERLSYYSRKNSNHQPVTTINLPTPNEPEKLERKLVEIKKLDGESTPTSSVKKSPEFTTFYKKFHGSAYEAGQKLSGSSKISNKTTQISSDAMNQSAYLDQLRAAEEKIKGLELQNKDYGQKQKNSAQKISQLQLKLNRMQKQIQEQKLESGRKFERINRLQEQVKDLTAKMGRANQQAGEKSREKNKQIESLKQSHANQLKNQQKQIERRVAGQKKNYDIKYESSINSLKQSYELKIVELSKQNEKMKVSLSAAAQSVDKTKAEVSELERNKFKIEAKLQQFTLQAKQLRQKVEYYQQKQAQSEKTANVKPETKQMGINAVVEERKQAESGKPKSATGNPISSISSENQEKEKKQLQQKLTNYLNNIDKQSQKIKEQKAEIDKSQRIIEEGNRLICEKESVIRNLMRDCKAMEKDLIEHRRVRRELESLVEHANSSLSQLHLSKLNNKYKDL